MTNATRAAVAGATVCAIANRAQLLATLRLTAEGNGRRNPQPPGHAGRAGAFGLRTGYPWRSASDRSWRSANALGRPASGITTPAHSPSAAGSSQASRAHGQRRGHARHSAFASSSGAVVQRSGSRAHAPCQNPPSAAAAVIAPPSRHTAGRCPDSGPTEKSKPIVPLPPSELPHANPLHAPCDTAECRIPTLRSRDGEVNKSRPTRSRPAPAPPASR